jgi:hypothetical protein
MLLLDEHAHPEWLTRQQIISELVEPCADRLELALLWQIFEGLGAFGIERSRYRGVISKFC